MAAANFGIKREIKMLKTDAFTKTYKPCYVFSTFFELEPLFLGSADFNTIKSCI